MSDAKDTDAHGPAPTNTDAAQPGAGVGVGRPLHAVEVRPSCPMCGSRRMHPYRTETALGIVYRRCDSCGYQQKFSIEYNSTVVVLRMRVEKESNHGGTGSTGKKEG